MNEEEVFQFVQVCNQQVKEFSALRNSLQNHFQLRRVLFESCFNAKLFDIEALIENLKVIFKNFFQTLNFNLFFIFFFQSRIL